MIDLHVMSLRRFFRGDFELPAVEGDESERMYGGGKPDDDAEEAERRVRAIQTDLSQRLGVDAHWPDTPVPGPPAYSTRIPKRMLHGLRSLAAHATRPHRVLFIPTRFRLLADPRTHSGLRAIYQGAETEFPHLMRHSDNRGFWFPLAFAEPLECLEPKWWRVGSVPGLESELDRILPMIEAMRSGPDREALHEAWRALHGATECSRRLRLPIIIDG
jgi:hypothetical protein